MKLNVYGKTITEGQITCNRKVLIIRINGKKYTVIQKIFSVKIFSYAWRYMKIKHKIFSQLIIRATKIIFSLLHRFLLTSLHVCFQLFSLCSNELVMECLETSCRGNCQETIGVHVNEQGQGGAGARSRATGITPEADKDC